MAFVLTWAGILPNLLVNKPLKNQCKKQDTKSGDGDLQDKWKEESCLMLYE